MPDYIPALAKLAVGVGANVSPGQTVLLASHLGQEELTRAIAAAAYDAGAHQVEVHYADPYVHLARLEHAPDEALGEVIPWVRERPRQLAEMRGATIMLSGPTAPGLLNDVDPARIGRDTVALVEWIEVLSERGVNWSIVPGPNAAWAKLVHPDLDDEAALRRLWAEIAHICRLDEDDPVRPGGPVHRS